MEQVVRRLAERSGVGTAVSGGGPKEVAVLEGHCRCESVGIGGWQALPCDELAILNLCGRLVSMDSPRTWPLLVANPVVRWAQPNLWWVLWLRPKY